MLNTNCWIYDLSYLGLISVSGIDADKFLQGQCTNDLRDLKQRYSQLGSHCNSRGRMIATFRLMRWNSVIYLQVTKTILPNLLELLNKYRLRAKVELQDANEKIQFLGISGEDALEMFNVAVSKLQEEKIQLSLHLSLPKINELLEHQSFLVMRMPGEIPRMQIFGSPLKIQSLSIELTNLGAKSGTVDQWKLPDIQACIPNLYLETSDVFVPQMVNLQLLDGVSFYKGCYTGQEVIHRLQRLGNLKRRLFRAEVATTICPQPGDNLHSEVNSSGQGAGKIVDAVIREDNMCELLAVIEIAAVQQGKILLGDKQDQLLQYLELPYAYPN
jgi:hypothetical protein